MAMVSVLGGVFSLLKRAPWRHIIAVGLAASGVAYLFLGRSTTQRLAAVNIRDEAGRFLDDQARNNPALADELARLRMSHGDLAVASKLKMDADVAARKLNVPPLAEQLARHEPIHEITLIGLATSTGMRVDDPVFEEFLTNYDQAIRLMPDSAARADILSQLEQVARSPEDWRVVRQGFDTLLVWHATRQVPALWEFYKAEHDWLAEPLMECALLEAAAADETLAVDENASGGARVCALLAAVQNHRDLVQQARDVMPEELGLVLHVFEGYGDVLELAQGRYGLPLDETLEVIYANPGSLDSLGKEAGTGHAGVEQQAALLDTIYKSNSNIWKHARTTPLALQLFLDAPTSADKILEDFGDNPGFLLQFYEAYRERNGETEGGEHGDPVFANAAASLAKFGDLAAITLFEYRDNPYFRDALGNKDIGPRIVPFVARFPDKLTAASKDPGYVNKHFDGEGKAIDDERWWEALPGGSIAKVAKNWGSGYPCDWSELGWAAFDVVDVGLIFFTAGTSKVITGGAKAGIKTTGKLAGRSLDRMVRMQAKGKRVLSAFGHTAASADDVARVTRVAAKPSMLRSFGQSLKSGMGKFSRSIESRADYLAKRTGRLGGKAHATNWRRLGYALALFKVYARKDALDKAPEQIGETLAGLVTEALQVAGEMLAGAAREFANRAGLSVPVPIVHAVIVGCLFAAAFVSWRLLRPKHVNRF